MDDYFVFEFISNNLFKQFIEILNIIINQEENNSKDITLRLTHDGIYIIRMTKSDMSQYCLKLIFNTNSFVEYKINHELEIIFNGQTFIKTCKNIQKNNDDHIKILYEKSELKIIITNKIKVKTETIILNDNNISCYIPQDKPLTMDITFKDSFYKFNTIDFTNLKKSINLKTETVNISLFEDKYIVFKSRSQGTSPLHILYGVLSHNENNENNEINETRIVINTKILNLLAKLNILTNTVNLHQSYKNNIIKIFGEFIHPKNNKIGEIEILLCDKN